MNFRETRNREMEIAGEMMIRATDGEWGGGLREIDPIQAGGWEGRRVFQLTIKLGPLSHVPNTHTHTHASPRRLFIAEHDSH